jgi:hypothetical protein
MHDLETRLGHECNEIQVPRKRASERCRSLVEAVRLANDHGDETARVSLFVRGIVPQLESYTCAFKSEFFASGSKH